MMQFLEANEKVARRV